MQRNGLSLCSGVGFIIGVLAGGMVRIHVLNSAAVPGAFGSAAEVRWWSTAERRPGNFPSHQGVGCFHGRQRALPFSGLCSPAGHLLGARFPKEVDIGKRLGSPDLNCSAGRTESLARAALPRFCTSPMQGGKSSFVSCSVLSYLVFQAAGIAHSINSGCVRGELNLALI